MYESGLSLDFTPVWGEHTHTQWFDQYVICKWGLGLFQNGGRGICFFFFMLYIICGSWDTFSETQRSLLIIMCPFRIITIYLLTPHSNNHIP